MRTRMLAGRTVAAIGLGDVSFARAAARGRDAGEVVRRMHEALEAAIDVIELAPEPDVERAAGEVVRALRARDRAVIVTRVEVLDARSDGLHERLPVGYVRERVEASLRATRLDALPLVQLPLAAAWRREPAWPELIGACERMVGEGKVLAWGAIVATEDAAAVSENHDGEAPAAAGSQKSLDELALAALLAAPVVPTRSGLILPFDLNAAAPAAPPSDATSRGFALAAPWLASLSIDLSLCERRAEPVLAAAPTHAIFARRPLAGGALAGALGPGAILARTDDRRGVDLDAIALGVAKLARYVAQTPPAARSTAAARAIAETSPRPDHVECQTLAEFALRFAIDRGALPLPRIHRADDLREAVRAASAAPLSPGLLNIDSVSFAT